MSVPRQRRASVAVYGAILRLYPPAFRDRWAGETVLLFAELARRRPPGPAGTAALWLRHLPDLAGGLFAEWYRELRRRPAVRHPALTHGAPAGALLSIVTVAGNLGHLWATPAARVASWLISGAAMGVLALTGPATLAAAGTVGRALRHGLLGGVIAFTAANLTATAVVLIGLDRLGRDSVQLAAFAASHETDFRVYQIHELLGGWFYGTVAGAGLGAALSGLAAAGIRLGRRLR
ncbi:hypothetical protein ACPPVO_16865 [Dactylosporangium sp. McL0621]|uniref:hypothetical protein n=1 Tax=Dactylosporangium sp. McL0621 TaxID=3415678 RepID=UPI003CECA00C